MVLPDPTPLTKNLLLAEKGWWLTEVDPAGLNQRRSSSAGRFVIGTCSGFRLADSVFMKLLGLTGGIGMGKSTVANALATVGWPVVDTDLLAREVVEPGQPALAEIRAVFGPTVLAPDGRLLREEMARRVFADDTSRKQLEKILHPRIRQLWKQQAARWHQAKVAWGVVVIPLLFETDAVAEFERIVCVACTASTQRQRLLARGWTEEDIIRRNAAQWPVEKKMAAADYVIWTEGPLEMMQRQVARVWETLKA